MKIYSNQFESEQILTNAIEQAKQDIETWRTSEGIPAPRIHPIVKKILDGESYEYFDQTVKEIEEEKREKEQAELEAEKLAAQKTPSEKYAIFRAAEYPSIGECVHAILDDELEELQIKRQEVKKKYPKPTGG